MTMTPETKTPEQIVADALREDTRLCHPDGAPVGWDAIGGLVASRLRAAGLLVEGAPSEELVKLRNVAETMSAVSWALRTRYTDNSDAMHFMRQIDSALAAAGAAPHESSAPMATAGRFLFGEPPAPTPDREKLIEEARRAVDRINVSAFPDDLAFQYRGGVLGREITLILRDMAAALASSPVVDDTKLAEVIWREQESRVLDGYVIHTRETARSTAHAVAVHLNGGER